MSSTSQRRSKRASSAGPSASAAEPDAPSAHSAPAAADSATDDKRSYNSQTYWDERYKQHLANAASAATGPAAAVSPASTKRKRAKAQTASSSAAAASDDITAEWYYSFKDLAHILLPAIATVDKSQSVLDIGCGISTFFEQLRAPVKQSIDSNADDDDDVGGGGFTGTCIGLDYSPTVIAHLAQQFPPASNPNLYWVCGDACHLLPDLVCEQQPDRIAGMEPATKRKGRKKQKATADEDAKTDFKPPALTAAEQALFTPESFSLIIDKATSDGMLCSDRTAVLTPLIYANVARLLAPNGVFMISSVNEPETGWFGEYVVSELIEHGGENVQWQIDVHTPSNYTDGEEGAPNVYIVRKRVIGRLSERSVRASTQKQREPYTIQRHCY